MRAFLCINPSSVKLLWATLQSQSSLCVPSSFPLPTPAWDCLKLTSNSLQHTCDCRLRVKRKDFKTWLGWTSILFGKWDHCWQGPRILGFWEQPWLLQNLWWKWEDRNTQVTLCVCPSMMAATEMILPCKEGSLYLCFLFKNPQSFSPPCLKQK